jgi:hypothetical protein
MPDDALTADDLALLDTVAELTAADVPQFDTLRAMYETEARLRVPAVIHSHTRAGVQSVELAGL